MSNSIYNAVFGHSYICDETVQNDCIFGRGSNGNSNNNLVTADSHYHYPDFKRYIFSTCNSTVWYIDNNNILSVVREKNTLRSSSILIDNVIDYHRKVTNNNRKPITGIYIIDYYNINTLRDNEKNILLNYYRHTRLDDNLSTLAFKHAYDTINNFDKPKTIPNSIQLRVITFISEVEFNNNVFLYAPNVDLLFIKGDIPNDITHPKYYKDNNKSNIAKTTIVFDLVDNESKLPYYIKIGNEIKKIYPIQDSSRVSECIVTFINSQTNDPVIDIYSKDNFISLGLYRTYEEALYNGNIPEAIEIIKLKNEINKLELAHKEHMQTMEHKEILANLAIHKLQLESSIMEDKYNKEQAMIKNKFILDTLLTNYKAILDLEKIKIIQTYEMTKNYIDISTKFLSIAKSLIF